jgi:hypothetical protein
MLVKWKRNQVFRAIEAAGLGPEGFVWDNSADDSCLRHRPSGAYFVFGGVAGSYFARYAAGDDTFEERPAHTWEGHMRHVEQWLQAVRRDTETPDLWSELRRQPSLTELLGGASDEALENTPFTPDERDEVARQLKQFREYVKATCALSDAQLVDFDSTLDYLVEATSRLSRKDWLLASLGGMFGYLFSVALPPDVARHIVQTLVSTIGAFFGHGIPGLGSG